MLNDLLETNLIEIPELKLSKEATKWTIQIIANITIL
jgi:hypothetical protein